MALKLEKLRARSASDKELRRRALLDAARRKLRRVSWSELTVADVARAAGLAKGSVFRYFPTKEALVLAVFELELAELFAALHEKLEPALARKRGLDAETFARTLVGELRARPVYLKVATVVHSVLEHNIELEAAVRFKRALGGYLAAGGALLERGLAFLRPGEGTRLLLRVHALLIGFWQLTDHPPIVAEALSRAGLEAFKFDFADELEDVLVTLLRGMEARK